MASRAQPRRRVSIRDIADAAGVSLTTVSHALNGKGRVQPQTRERIFALAAELGYSANPHAQRLATGRHMMIAVQISGFGGKALATDSAYFVDVLNSVSAAALDHGYTAVLAAPDMHPRDVDAFAVDGAIVVDPTGEEPLLTTLARRGAPVVTTGRVLDGDVTSGWVDNDLRKAAVKVLDHFLEAGYERPAILTGPLSRSYAADTLDAYEQWARERGIRPVSVAVRTGMSAAAAMRAAEQLLGRRERPDAVYAMLDVLALATAHVARRRGLTVPGDLGIAAAFDSEVLRWADPPLTAFDLHPARIGREAVELLTAVLADRAPRQRSVTVPARLITRASTDRSGSGSGSASAAGSGRAAG